MKKCIKFQDTNELCSCGNELQGCKDELWVCTTLAEYEELKNRGIVCVPLSINGERFDNAPYVLEGKLEDFDNEYLYKIMQRLTNKPWKILETKRLIVREMTVDDVDSFYEIYKKPGITDYMEDLFEDPTDEKLYTQGYIKNIYGFYGFGLWTVIHKESRKIIGRAGLSMEDGFEYPDLGFVIDKDYQHSGLAFEVCSAILEYAKNELELNTVQARVKPENSVSIALLKKLGFEFNHTLHQGYLIALHTYA